MKSRREVAGVDREVVSGGGMGKVGEVAGMVGVGGKWVEKGRSETKDGGCGDRRRSR